MGIKNCCCTYLDLTEDFEVGDNVQIRTVSDSIEYGEIKEIRENTIVLDKGESNFIVICCAHIVSIEPLSIEPLGMAEDENGNGEEP